MTRIEILKVERVDPLIRRPWRHATVRAAERQVLRRARSRRSEERPHHRHPARARATRAARSSTSATFSLMKPVDGSKASGVMIYSVVNRGNGAAAASAEGHISLVSGWQGDVVPTATNQTIQVPRAKNP